MKNEFVVITMHEVNEVFDGGHCVLRSPQFPLPRDITAAALHRITWPQMGPFILQQVQDILDTPGVTIH